MDVLYEPEGESRCFHYRDFVFWDTQRDLGTAAVREAGPGSPGLHSPPSCLAPASPPISKGAENRLLSLVAPLAHEGRRITTPIRISTLLIIQVPRVQC